MVDLVESWLAAQIASTRRVYATVARDLARAIGPVEQLLVDPYACRELVLRYRDSMVQRGLGVATAATRMGVVQGLLEHARQAGVIDWTVDLAVPPSCWGPDMGFEGVVGEESCG